MAFDWQTSSLEQTVEHVLLSSHSAVSRARKYYVEKSFCEVVERIDEARRKAVIIRLSQKLEKLK